MLNSAECPLQGAKCLECPFNKCELRAASNSQEMLKCSATQSYRYVRSFFYGGFFFFLFNKVCVMPLSSMFFRGEDSTGNVLVCSTFPSCNLSWFCFNWHVVVCRSRAPIFTTDSLHRKPLSCNGSKSRVGNPPRCKWHLWHTLPFSLHKQRVVMTCCIHPSGWEALQLNTSGTYPSCLRHGK